MICDFESLVVLIEKLAFFNKHFQFIENKTNLEIFELLNTGKKKRD